MDSSMFDGCSLPLIDSAFEFAGVQKTDTERLQQAQNFPWVMVVKHQEYL
jgi:hypothetical protein